MRLLHHDTEMKSNVPLFGSLAELSSPILIVNDIDSSPGAVARSDARSPGMWKVSCSILTPGNMLS